MTFEFFRISKTNLISVEYLKRHFLNHPACFFCSRPLIDRWTFCSRCLDLYLSHCTGPELFPELLLSPNNFHVCSLKVFILTKWELLSSFLISWRKLTECYSKLLPTNSATYRLFSCIFYESISIGVSKKVYMISWYHVTFGYVAKM